MPDGELTAAEANRKTFQRLKALQKLSLLESYAAYMGKAQLMEFRLKGLLIHKYGCSEEKVKNWPLGKIISKLKRKGVRKDLLLVVDQVRKDRNHIAHEFLADWAIVSHFLGKRAGRFRPATRPLEHAQYRIEYLGVVYEFLFENDYLESKMKPKLPEQQP